MLSIQNLTHTYPNGVTALNHLNLQIAKGMFGLLGPNGAGKSSLMRTIATLQKPTGGGISFGDIDVLSQPTALRRTLGYLPQDFGVYPRGSAFDHLDHLALLKGLVNPKQRKQVVEKLLVETNLYADRKRRLSTFSGGMLRRFGIAQALIGDPKLIIVDEPTAGLDPAERNRFHNLLAEIGEDIVVILSTHIIEDVRELCPNMAVMDKGRILIQGTPSALIDNLKGRVWSKKIARADLAACQRQFHLISHHLSAGQTQIRVLAGTQPAEGFQPAEASLSDVYFSALHANASSFNQAS
jgi:ABC-type multidrug transport system ATPase subunit